MHVFRFQYAYNDPTREEVRKYNFMMAKVLIVNRQIVLKEWFHTLCSKISEFQIVCKIRRVVFRSSMNNSTPRGVKFS